VSPDPERYIKGGKIMAITLTKKAEEKKVVEKKTF